MVKARRGRKKIPIKKNGKLSSKRFVKGESTVSSDENAVNPVGQVLLGEACEPQAGAGPPTETGENDARNEQLGEEPVVSCIQLAKLLCSFVCAEFRSILQRANVFLSMTSNVILFSFFKVRSSEVRSYTTDILQRPSQEIRAE